MSQTVARAIDIVRFVSTRQRSLGDVADHLDVHKSTARRLLQTLEEEGFVRRGVDGRCSIGFQLIALGQIALEQVEARTVAHAALVELADKVGHTVHFAQLVETNVVYIDEIDCRGSVAMGSRIGLMAQLHTAGVAKAIIANQDEPLLTRLIDSMTWDKYTATTITSSKTFRAEVDAIRARGWAEDDGEHEDYINCVALPVYDARGAVTYGISVTALRAVADLKRLRDDLPLFQEVAEKISRNLGWKGSMDGQRRVLRPTPPDNTDHRDLPRLPAR
jgi:DNA-binding IclR family transcriptional regulator